MTGREIVRRAVLFESPPRLGRHFLEKFGSDFAFVGMSPSPDARGTSGADEWGAVWQNMGTTSLGEVKEFPLKDWGDFDKLNIPDIHRPDRWSGLDGARERAGGKFLMAEGISLYERVHFIRGLENTWIDIYENLRELSIGLSTYLSR